jgi:hypothetical protein
MALEQIALPDLPRILRQQGVLASYHDLWRRVVAGELPAERQGRRWTVKREDLPAIARTVAQASR